MQGEKKVVDRFLTFLILTRYRKICCNTNRRKAFETYKAARRGPAFAVLDWKFDIYCFVILLEIFSQERAPSFTILRSHMTSNNKTVSRQNHRKSMTTEGNSALLPAIRELKQKRRPLLRKRHLKR